MADVVAITAGSGTNISTDERTIGGTAQHVQRVNDIGGSAIASGQLAPTTTAATLLAARDTRKRVVFYNVGSVDVYVGPATVTTSNGLKVPAGATLTLHMTALIQAITASGTGSVHYLEEYDA